MWIACARPAFQLRLAEIQQRLQLLTGLQLVDLHVSDLLNAQLPSHYDYTVAVRPAGVPPTGRKARSESQR